MKQRNSGVELLRILLMLGIVALHTLCYVGKGLTIVAHLCEACVVGFVFISGYYGISFTIRKLVSFYGVVLFCAGWNILCRWLSDCEADKLWGHFWEYLRVWWFANAYVFLMLMSPLVNKSLDACRTTRELLYVVAPAVSIVYIWGFASTVPFLHTYIPIDKSIATNSGLTLMAIYILSRVFKILDVENRLRFHIFVIVGGASAIVCMFNLGKYNSLFAFMFMASLFVFFKKLGECSYRGWGLASRIVTLCAPSMFSVYLIHVGGFVRLPGGGLSTVHLAGNDPSVMRLMCIVILIFIISLCVDLMRRGFLTIVRRIVSVIGD